VTRYDGLDADSLARALDVPRAVVFDEIGSTMDAGHAAAAEGTPSGTVVIADAQTAGRGRAGRRWASERGAGIWLTLVERPSDAAAIDVLSLRLGLAAAAAVDAFAAAPVRLKWPNDVYAGDGKLAGVLVEARWRDGRPEWVAIGVGMNVVAPEGVATAAGLRPGARRLDVLRALVPALREAAGRRGPLAPEELAAFARRDLAVGRRVLEPLAGVVRGVTPAGELAVEDDDGRVATARHGSLVFADSREPV
jgi:BirA family biotin operon repressor/biotin-[acetyl-CoA-carboxylase] ligase